MGAREKSMKVREIFTNERGSALLEFIGVGMILLAPLLYLSITVAKIQSAGIAVQNAAKVAARVFVEADDIDQAVGRAHQQARYVLESFGIESSAYEFSYICEADPCLQADAAVEIKIAVQVQLPLVPQFLGEGSVGAIQQVGSAVYQVSRYRQ